MFPQKYIAIGIGVLVVIGMFTMMTLEIKRLRAVEENLTTQLTAETQRADNNAAAVARYAAAAAHNAEIAEQVRDDRDALDRINRQIMEEIANAPDADDTRLSPVMLRALDGLRDAFDAAACRSALRDGRNPDGANEVPRCGAPAGGDGNGTAAGGVADAGDHQRVGLPLGRGKARRSALTQGAQVIEQGGGRREAHDQHGDRRDDVKPIRLLLHVPHPLSGTLYAA